jgi:RNA ligase
VLHLRKFPNIFEIDDVLPYIEDDDDFVVVDKDGDYTVINYVRQGPDTFPPIDYVPSNEILDTDAMIRRECRGILFRTSTGEILSRRLHKFFNVGERHETESRFVSLNQPHVILNKLDGSMITPIHVEDGSYGGAMRWGTKMGVTDVSMLAEAFVSTRPQYDDFAWYCHHNGLTPIFEFCSRDNRVVIDYPEPSLTLLVIRHTKSGNYVFRSDMIAGDFEIPSVLPFTYSRKSISDIVESVRTYQDSEGVVIRFHSGEMVKIKADKYVSLHKTKEAIQYERNLVDLVINQHVDDLLPHMSDDMIDRTGIYTADFWTDLAVFETRIANSLKRWSVLDRKDFAIKSEGASWITPLERSFVFKCWDNPENLKTTIEEHVRRNLGSEKSFQQKVKPILKSANWSGVI